MSKIYFTSDTHFGHKNIIKYTNRPFSSVNEMDQKLIDNWNERVEPTDIVYHLGDFALCSPQRLKDIISSLNGQIRLIKGNHEKAAMANKELFDWVGDYKELVIEDESFPKGKQLIVLFHYALRVWNASHHGAYHLYGHSHNTLEDDINSLSFDAGVDSHDFYPIDWEEVKAIMKKKDWKSPF